MAIRSRVAEAIVVGQLDYGERDRILRLDALQLQMDQEDAAARAAEAAADE